MSVTAVDAAGNTLEAFTLTAPPRLSLAADRTYWSCYSDYLIRRLSVDYRVVNSSYPVHDLTIVATRASHGVSVLDGGPVPLGSLEPGGRASFTVLYFVPEQVSRFWSISYATCRGAGGNLFNVPAPAPAG